jgi:hypothetical protein
VLLSAAGEVVGRRPATARRVDLSLTPSGSGAIVRAEGARAILEVLNPGGEAR